MAKPREEEWLLFIAQRWIISHPVILWLFSKGNGEPRFSGLDERGVVKRTCLWRLAEQWQGESGVEIYVLDCVLFPVDTQLEILILWVNYIIRTHGFQWDESSRPTIPVVIHKKIWKQSEIQALGFTITHLVSCRLSVSHWLYTFI